MSRFKLPLKYDSIAAQWYFARWFLFKAFSINQILLSGWAHVSLTFLLPKVSGFWYLAQIWRWESKHYPASRRNGRRLTSKSSPDLSTDCKSESSNLQVSAKRTQVREQVRRLSSFQLTTDIREPMKMNQWINVNNAKHRITHCLKIWKSIKPKITHCLKVWKSIKPKLKLPKQ